MSNITYKDDTPEISLTKWPGFLVVGDKVTEDQAAEILIKTDGYLPNFRYASNDKTFDKDLCVLFNVPYERKVAEKNFHQDDYKKIMKLRENLGMVPELEYIANHRIVSSWIGGPHGWCNWNGDVFCNNFNIGKWPSVVSVSEEWGKIAGTFPFLKLKSQLMSGESCEDNTVPVVEFEVSDGTVIVRKPENKLVPMVFDVNGMVMGMFSPKRERGIEIPFLTKKLNKLYKDKIPQYK